MPSSTVKFVFHYRQKLAYDVSVSGLVRAVVIVIDDAATAQDRVLAHVIEVAEEGQGRKLSSQRGHHPRNHRKKRANISINYEIASKTTLAKTA